MSISNLQSLNSNVISTSNGAINGFTRGVYAPDTQIFNKFPKVYEINSFSSPVPKEFGLEEVKVDRLGCKVLAIAMPIYSPAAKERFSELTSKLFNKIGDPICLQVDPCVVENLQPSKEMENEIYNFCLKELNIKIVQLGDFTAEDLKVLGYTAKEIGMINNKFKAQWEKGHELALPKLACYEFALLRAKEQGVREQLFTAATDTQVLFERLKRWGYESINSPKEGDLIMYLDKGFPKHLGRYLGGANVESKFGSEVVSTIHKIEMVPENYGLQIVFYRKTSAGNYDEKSVPKFVYQKSK